MFESLDNGSGGPPTEVSLTRKQEVLRSRVVIWSGKPGFGYMDPLASVVVAIWLMLPAYVPNNAAVLVGGGRPIDGGWTYRGARLLGDGKTWRGTLGGSLVGMILAVALNGLEPSLGGWLPGDVPVFPAGAIFALPIGAMLGDIAASFLKRRLGRERGAAVPGLDQYDLVAGALGLTALVSGGWLGSVLTWPVLAVILVLTPILHVGTNVLAYALGITDVPW